MITRVIDHSAESARIILFASRSFLTDTMLDLAASGLGTRYLKPLQLVENAVDWSLEENEQTNGEASSALLGKLAGLRIQALLGTAAEPEYGQEPAGTRKQHDT